MRLHRLISTTQLDWSNANGPPVEDHSMLHGSERHSGNLENTAIDGVRLMSEYFSRLLTLLGGVKGMQSERSPLSDLFFAAQNFAAHSLSPPKERTMIKLGCLDFVDFCAPLIDVSNRKVIYMVNHSIAEKHRAWERDLESLANEVCPVSSPHLITTDQTIESLGTVAAISIIMLEPHGSQQVKLQELEKSLDPYCDLILLGRKHLIEEFWAHFRKRGLILENEPQILGPAKDDCLNDLRFSYGVIIGQR